MLCVDLHILRFAATTSSIKYAEIYNDNILAVVVKQSRDRCIKHETTHY